VSQSISLELLDKIKLYIENRRTLRIEASSEKLKQRPSTKNRTFFYPNEVVLTERLHRLILKPEALFVEHLSSLCRAFVEHLSSICRAFVEHLSSICRAFVKHLSSICRAFVEHLQAFPNNCRACVEMKHLREKQYNVVFVELRFFVKKKNRFQPS
jgi:hypothetical protein